MAQPGGGRRDQRPPHARHRRPPLLRQIADEAQAGGRGLPCRILCTGSPGEALAADADAALAKPVSLAALRRALQGAGVHPGPAVVA